MCENSFPHRMESGRAGGRPNTGLSCTASKNKIAPRSDPVCYFAGLIPVTIFSDRVKF